jgi:nitrogen fixation protein NifB
MLPAQGRFTAEQRTVIRNELAAGMKQTAAAHAQIQEEWNDAVRVAVATRGSNVINQHFGHAKEFIIYDVRKGNIRLVGVRKVQAYCNGTRDCGSPISEAVDMLKDCSLLLCSGIGEAPAGKLRQAGIIPLVRTGDIDGQLLESTRYLQYFQ